MVKELVAMHFAIATVLFGLLLVFGGFIGGFKMIGFLLGVFAVIIIAIILLVFAIWLVYRIFLFIL